MDFTITNKGRAATTFTVFVDPFLRVRKNLVVRIYSQVNKVLFKGKTSVGVEYERHGKKFIAHVRKEVILSAGVFGFPILLFKSGIGPKKLLEKAKVEIQILLYCDSTVLYIFRLSG